MHKSIFIIGSLLFSIVQAQDIAIQTFGNPKEKALIFLHGGPGFHSLGFEKTTAENLASSGFFVISYDRRGEGRNDELKAAYTFEQTLEDLDGIYEKYQLEAATLIGHSFGGIVGTLFAEKYPDKIQSLILVGAPPALQETFKTIIASSRKIYQEKKDQVNLNYINMLEKMDSSSLMYSSYCFMHAMQNGFYSPKKPNKKAQELYGLFRTDEALKKYAQKMDYVSPQKFWENEQYTSMSIKDNLIKLSARGLKIYGLYGQDDGLYSVEQVEEIRSILGEDNVKYLENCSHNVFIDRQEVFVEALNKWVE